ncbi:MAG: hypothetical protein HPY53_16605 [Brevinematales bacterium]|nr:hypothetical protein [Brevinematales bacterium]
MKILILNALKEWILKAFSEDTWKEIAESSGLGVEQFREGDKVFSDDRFALLLAKMVKLLNLEEAEIIDQFVHYWMTDFAPRIYSYYLKKSATAKEFVLGIFQMNNLLCKLFPNKHLSMVDYQEIDRKTLAAVYPSEKALVDIVAILRGVNAQFTDRFTIRKINPHSVEIKFEKQEEV